MAMTKGLEKIVIPDDGAGPRHNMDYAFAFEDVHFEYRTQRMVIFHDFNISVATGEFVLLEGPNGVGKSTFLDLVGGLKKPQMGRVNVRAQQREYLQQDYVRSLFPWRKVAWNICLPLLARRKMSKSEIFEMAQRLCKDMEVDLRLEDFPFDLSGGQKHLVTLLRSFAASPDLLLLDEPATGLDQANLEKFWATLCRFKAKTPGLTIVCVSHQMPQSLPIPHTHLKMVGPPSSLVPIQVEEAQSCVSSVGS
jgi:NitT/TauT family transport system ATP-binding protein